MTKKQIVESLKDMKCDFEYIGSCCADEYEVLEQGLDKLEKLISKLEIAQQ